MSILEAKHIHCIGIGGAGVSALAGLLVGLGKEVTGTEDNASPTTLDPLREKGVVVYGVSDELPSADVFVYSDAWLLNHPEVLESARTRGVPVYSYFTALGEVSQAYTTIAVAGTHGKTTTTAMLARMLERIDPTVIVGSIMKDTGSNVRIGRSEYLLVEACEYRDHFLELAPKILVITNIELDHTDYFKSMEQLRESYRKLVAKIPADGALILNLQGEEEKLLAEHAACQVIDYSLVSVPDLLVPGAFNVCNAKAAYAAATVLGDADEEALATFPGTWRRFEYRGKTHGGALVYDDYGHHPTEVKSTLIAAQEHFPSKKVVVAFHPHLYSRTRDFLEEFGEALSYADHVFVAPVFAAREVFDGKTDNAAVVQSVREHGGAAETISGKEELQAVLEEQGDDVVFFTMGAGDIYSWVPEYISTNLDREA